MAIPPIDNSIQPDAVENIYSEIDIDDGDEYDYEDEIADEIAEAEEPYMDIEKVHNNYYIGSAVYIPQNNSIQLDNSVSPTTLFSYDIFDIQIYLATYSICNIMRTLPYVHILKLDIKPDGEYCALIKTFWLKIIQRAWKKRFAQIQLIKRSRGSIPALRHFELTGNYPQGLRNIPGLNGLLYGQCENAGARNESRCSRIIRR
jgi:hypothetical protein